jgi:hypothetical protein
MWRMSRNSLAGLGILLFLLSWGVANAPGGMSDEPDQYIKAIAAGEGDVFGQRVNRDQATAMDYWLPRLSGILIGYPAGVELARAFTLSSHYDPRYLGCTFENPAASAVCLNQVPPRPPPGNVTMVSSVGSYQPFIYIPAGWAMLTGGGAVDTLYRGRVVFVVINALLLFAAISLALERRRSAVMLPAIALAVTPTAVLCMATLSSSGPEIASGIAWWVAILAVTTPDPPRRAWIVLLCAGVVLALARPTGPLWILVASGLVILVMRGVAGAWHAFRRGGRMAIAAVVTVAAAIALSVAWQLTQQPRYPLTLSAVPFEPQDLLTKLNQVVGTIGWGEAGQQPAVLILAWTVVAGVLVFLALTSAVARRVWREAVALVALIVMCVGIVAAFLVYGSHSGVVQGRWFGAVFAGIPIVAGWSLAHSYGAGKPALDLHRVAERIAPPLLVVIVVCLAAAWWFNARRYAVGYFGPTLFLDRSQWNPPFGWIPWLVLGGVGLLLLSFAGVSHRGLPTDSSARAPLQASHR